MTRSAELIKHWPTPKRPQEKAKQPWLLSQNSPSTGKPVLGEGGCLDRDARATA